jgi:DNA-binding MarR family transcriptional regulator
MALEEDIKQKKFKNEHQKMMVNILFTANWINYAQAKLMKGFGITPQQFNILRILKGQLPEAASVNLLIDRMLDKMSNASRLVEKLRLKGYVERKQSDKDRRQVDVIITSVGLEIVEKITKELEQFEKAFMNTISELEAKEINRILDLVRR